MNPASPLAALRSGRTALHHHQLRLALSVGLLAIVYGAIQLTGGTPNPLVHFLYIPVVVVATTWGWVGGLLVGTVAGLLAGPLSHDSTAASLTFLGTWGWLIRFLAYQLAGVFAGVLFERSRRIAGEARAAEERARAAATIRSSETRLRAVLEACADGMVVIDRRGTVTLVNAAVERLVLRHRSDIVGRRVEDPVWRMAMPEGTPIVDLGSRFRALIAAEPRDPLGDVVLARSDGTPVVVSVTAVPLGAPGAGEEGAVITLRDVTAERSVARSSAARADSLRTAAHRAAGEGTAERAAATLLAEFGRLWPIVAAAIYVYEGDGAHRLAGWSAPGLDPVYPPRIAGPVATQLRRIADQGRLRRLHLRSVATDEERLERLAAAGGQTKLVVPLPIDGTIAGVLVAVDRRDHATRDAAEDDTLLEFGRMSAAIVRRAELDEVAVAARDRARIGAVLDAPERIQPVFQPILSLARGRVVAYEALARFAAEPVQPPLAWFAKAAEVGLGAELQALALRRALEVADERRLPRNASLTVNVSPGFLDDPGITLALAERRIERLVVETTEDEPVEDYGRIRAAMARLRAAGIRFAVDDAGAGYASMMHVTELRPEFVKLDAKLIRGVGNDAGRLALVRALETFSRDIGATLIAEGVEAASDLELLASTGLPILAQGYAIARPGPAWPAIDPQAVAMLRAVRDPVTPPARVRRRQALESVG